MKKTEGAGAQGGTQVEKPLEMQQETTGALSTERTAFIMKVYGLLTLAILTAAIGASMGGFVTMASYFPITIAGFLALIGALIFRKVPGLNMALLFGFTFLNGLSAGPIINYHIAHGHGHVVTQALFMTFGTFAALTAYVFWSKQDFSYLKGFLWSGLIALILVALVGMFFGMSSTASLIYSYFGVLIFVGYTLYDTSNLIHRFNTDEYVVATLELFLDIVNLFWFILRIFLSRED
jgi:modulator of FtsH protease